MTGSAHRPGSRAGYILVETVIAMALLSVGAITINGALSQTILVRGQARDYTQAQFLLERIIGELEVNAVLEEETRQGTFDPPYERFAWRYEIVKEYVELPPLPDDKVEEEERRPFVLKIKAVVSWTRQGSAYEETMETLHESSKWFDPETLR